MPEGLWGRPAVPGDSGQVPWASDMDQQSRTTQTCVIGHAASTSCPGRLGPWSKGPPGGPAVPGDSTQGMRACGVDHLNRVTHALVPGLSQVSQGTRVHVRGPEGPTSCPGGLVLVLRAPGVDQWSGRHRSRSEAPRFRKGVPGDSRSGSRAREFDPMSLATRAWFRCPAGSTRSQRQLGPKPSPRGSTRCPGRLWPSSMDLQGQPALTGHSDLGPRSRGYYQLSRVCCARVRLPAGLNSSPG